MLKEVIAAIVGLIAVPYLSCICANDAQIVGSLTLFLIHVVATELDDRYVEEGRR